MTRSDRGNRRRPGNRSGRRRASAHRSPGIVGREAKDVQDPAPRSTGDRAEAGSGARAVRSAEVPGSNAGQIRCRLQAAIAQLAHIETGLRAAFPAARRAIAAAAPQPGWMLQHDPAGILRPAGELRGKPTAQQRELQQQADDLAQQAQQREAQAEQAHHAEQHQPSSSIFPNTSIPRPGRSSSKNFRPSPGN
jgi:hypothetical protein